MSSLKLFGALLEHGVMHNKETTSTSVNPLVSSMHDATVYGLDNDRRSVHLEESQELTTKDATEAVEATDHAPLSSTHDAAVHALDNDRRSVHLEESKKLIKKAATDAVEATGHASLEMGRLIRILGNLYMDGTTGHGSEFKVRLAPIVDVESAALEVAKASADAALHAKLMIEAAVNSSDVLEEHATETDLEDVRRANDLNLICKDINLAVKGLSDALGNLFTEEPNSLKSTDVVHFGPNDFGEAMGVTSATLGNRTNPTEDDASSAKQAELENPDSEVGRGTQNANLVQLDSNLIAERKSGTFVPTRRKRKPPSSVKDVHRKENVPSSSNTSNPNEMKNLVSNTTPEKLVHFGPNDFEAMSVTSATLANRTNPTEDDASSAKQAELEYPDSEDRGTQNANLVQLDSNFIAERTSGNFVPSRHKRKHSSSVKDVHKKENVPCSSNTSNLNEMKNLVSNTSPEKLVSYTPEPRRSSRKIQPTLKILEGLETECIPVESLENCNRTQRRSNSSQVSAESKEGK